MKYRTGMIVFLAFLLGLSVPVVIDMLRDLSCNIECKAQLLYKNSAFYDVRGHITELKKEPTSTVVLNQSRYTPAYLHESGIDLLIVMESGEFILTSRFDRLAMLAKPTFNGNRLIWRCQFFNGLPKPPAERTCSF